MIDYKDLILQAQNGDKESLADLIQNLEGYIKLLLKGCFTLSKVQLEDSYNSAIIGLMRALQKFDTTRDIQLMTFARKFIVKDVIKFLSKDATHSKIIVKSYKGEFIREISTSSLEVDIATNEYGETVRLGDVIGDVDNQYSASEDKVFLEQLFNTLSCEESDFITEFYSDDRCIGRLDGYKDMSKSGYYKKKDRIITKLRKEVFA